MSTIATLNTKFTADTRDFDRALSGVERSIGTVERSLRGVGTSVTRAMSGAAVGLGVAAGAATAFVASSASAAMRVGELDVAMQAVAKSSGYSYDEMVKAVAGIRKTGIEYATAQQVALQFARANLNMADATKLARVAQDAAVIGQVNSTEALDRLLHGITTLNPIILRQLGILVDAETAYENYAKANNIASGRSGQFSQVLDGTQKQAAFLNEVMLQGAKIAGTYEAAMSEPGKVLRSFARLINDAQVAIGKGFTPALGAAILPLYNFVKSITGALEPGGKLAPLVKALGDAISTLLKPLEGVVKRMDAWFKALKPADVDKIAKSFKEWFPIILAVSTALTVFAGKSLLTTVPLLGDLTRNLNPVTAGFLALVAADPALRGMFVEMLKNLRPLAKELLPAFKTVMGELEPAAGVVIDALGVLVKAIAGLVPVVVPVVTQLVRAFGEIAVVVVSDVLPAFFDFVNALVRAFVPIVQAVIPVATSLFKVLADVVWNLLDALTPVIKLLGDAFLKVMEALAPVIPQIAMALGKIVIAFVEGFAAVLPAIIPLIGVFAKIIEAMAPVAIFLANALVKVIEAIPPPVLGAMIAAWLAFKFATRGARDSADGLAGKMRPLGVSVGIVQIPMAALVPLLLAATPVFIALAGVITALHPVVSALANAFSKLPPGVIVALTTAFVAMVGTFKILTTVTQGLEAVARTVNAPFDTWRDTMATVRSVSDTLGKGLELLAGRILAKSAATTADTGAELTNTAATSGGIVATLASGAARVALAVKTGIVTVATKIWTIAQAAAAAALWATAAPILVVVGGILLIVAAVAALAVGIYFLVKHWDAVWGAIKSAFEAVWNALKTFIGWFVNTFFGSWQKTVRTLLLVFVPFVGIPIQIIRNWSKIKQFFVDLFNTLVGVFKTAIDFMIEHWRYFALAFATILLGPIGLVIAGFFLFRDTFMSVLRSIGDFFASVWEGIKNVFMAAINFITDNWKWFVVGLVTILTGPIGAIIALFALFPDRVIAIFKDAISWLVQAGKDIATGLVNGIVAGAEAVWNWLKALPGRILSFFTDAAKWLFNVGKQIIFGSGLLGGMIEQAKKMWEWFLALPGRLLGFFVDAVRWLFNSGVTVLTGLFNGIVSGAVVVWNFFSGLLGRILGFFGNAARWLWDKGWAILKGLAEGIASGAEAVWNFFKDLPGRILGFFKDAGNWLLNAGKDLIGGLANGVKDAAEGAVNAVKGVGDKVVGGLKGLLGIGSPSTVFMDIGGDLGLGLAIGIENSAAVVAAASRELVDAATVSLPGVAAPSVAGAGEIPPPDTSALESSYEAAGDAAASWGSAVEDAADVQAAALSAAQGTLDAFSAAQQATLAALASTMTTIVTSLAATITTIWTNLTQQIQALTTQLSQQVQAIVNQLDAMLRSTFQSLINFLVTQWTWLRDRLKEISENLSLSLRGIFDQLQSSLRAGWQSTVENMVTNTRFLRDRMVEVFTNLRDQVGSISNQMLTNFRQVMTAMVEAGTTGGRNTAYGVHTNLNSQAGPIRDVVRNYAYELRNALNPILEGVGKDKIKLPFARGGTVPGSGDRDKVEALLTPGEFVIPRRAAERLGKDTLEQLRRGWLPLTSQRGPQRFQAGGQVQPQVRELANLVLSKVPGLRATSWFRPGGTSYHGKGQAVDIAGGIPAMRQAASFINTSGVWQSLAEGIFNPSGGGWPTWLSVKNNRQVPSSLWGGGTWAGHADHLHLAISGPIGEVSGDGLLVTEAIQLKDVPDVKKFGNMLGRTYGEAMEYVKKAAQEWVNQNTFVFDDFGGDGAAAPEGQIKQWLTAAIQHVGGSMSWIGPLYGRLMQESGGNPRAINLWDSNAKAGIPSKGLMQTIDPTFQAYRDKSLPNDVYNPVANIVAAINYMLARYKRIVGPSSTGYAAGGIVAATPGGRSILAGEGGRDEAVIPLPRGWRAMMNTQTGSLSPAGDRTAPAVNIEHYEVKENADHRRVFAMAEFEQRAGRI